MTSLNPYHRVGDQIKIHGCSFNNNGDQNNTSAGAALYYGGAGGLEILNSSFEDNRAKGNGGAISINANGYNTVIDNCIFDDNGGNSTSNYGQ